MNVRNLSWFLGFATGAAISLIINKNSEKVKRITTYRGAGYLPERKPSRHLYDDSGIYYV
jgi:hypothetical protein